MKKLIGFILSMVLALVLCAGQAHAVSWAYKSMSALGQNGTAGDNGDYGPVLPILSASADQWLRFVITFDEEFCPGGAVKDFKLGVARGTALSISTDPQATNSSYEFMSELYELNFRYIGPNGAITAWQEHPMLASQNSTGGDPDIAAGQRVWYEFHGQVNGLDPGGMLIVDVSRNATNSGDNSTSADPVLGLWWKQQEGCN